MKTLSQNLSGNISFGDFKARHREGTKVMGKPVTLIIDGFEKAVTKPKGKRWESITWSQKKKQNSFNTLIAISPHTKRIRFLSQPWSGASDDLTVAKNELRKIKPWLSNDDHIIGDEGFNGLEYLNVHTISNRSTEFPARKSFNEKRALVENAISDLRGWKCLHDPLKTFMHDKSSYESERILYYDYLKVLVSIHNMIVDEKVLNHNTI